MDHDLIALLGFLSFFIVQLIAWISFLLDEYANLARTACFNVSAGISPQLPVQHFIKTAKHFQMKHFLATVVSCDRVNSNEVAILKQKSVPS